MTDAERVELARLRPMTDRIETLYAVVPWLPDAPPLNVLNMPEPIRLRERSLPMKALLDTDEDYLPATVDLVLGWNAEEAAHIEAVTGHLLGRSYAAGRWLDKPYGERYEPGPIKGIVLNPRKDDPVVREDEFTVYLPPILSVGVVAARFHVTGCHRAEVLRREAEITVRLCCSTPWSHYDDDWWHWTGHAEKVQP